MVNLRFNDVFGIRDLPLMWGPATFGRTAVHDKLATRYYALMINVLQEMPLKTPIFAKFRGFETLDAASPSRVTENPETDAYSPIQ
jgi:hypothetical protein